MYKLDDKNYLSQLLKNFYSASELLASEDFRKWECNPLDTSVMRVAYEFLAFSDLVGTPTFSMQ